MQASAATSHVTAKDVAGEMLVLWHSIMREGAQNLWRCMDELGLGMTQVKALYALSGCTSEVSVKELAERLGMSLPNTSRTVDGLLRKGMLERREDEHDRRMKRVGITPAGAAAVERIDTARLQGLEAWAETLTPEQRTALHTALSSLPHKDPA